MTNLIQFPLHTRVIELMITHGITHSTFHYFRNDFLWSLYHELNQYLVDHGEIEGNIHWLEFTNDIIFEDYDESVCSLELYNQHQIAANLYNYLLNSELDNDTFDEGSE